MSKTASITIGGEKFIVHRFNIGELERVSMLFESAPTSTMKTAFGILRIALERAEPKIEDVSAFEIDSIDEVIEASNAILTLAGMNKPKANGSADPQTGPAAGS
jgi:hypothetical protein